MDTQHIRYIRCVADMGSISAAARELGLTQSAITKIVSRAEDQVGVQLFERKSRGVELTPYGQLFLNWTAKIEREMFNLSQEVKAMKAGEGGTVRIGVGQFWIGKIVPNIIAKLTKTSPEIQVKIDTRTREDNIERLHNGDIDILLGRLTNDLPNTLTGEPLAVLKLYLLVGTHHPLIKLGPSIKLDDLEPYGWILPSPMDPTAMSMSQIFAEKGFIPNSVPVEAASRNFTTGLLQASDLITAITDITTNSVSEGLCRLEVEDLDWSVSAGAIRVTDRTLLPCCNRFLNLLREEMKRINSI